MNTNINNKRIPYDIYLNLIQLLTSKVDGLMRYFPNPNTINEQFIVEHLNARKKMNDALFLLRRLLKSNLKQTQIDTIYRKWTELERMKTVRNHRFDKINNNLFKNNNEMNAYFTLSQFIYEYEFFKTFIDRHYRVPRINV